LSVDPKRALSRQCAVFIAISTMRVPYPATVSAHFGPQAMILSARAVPLWRRAVVRFGREHGLDSSRARRINIGFHWLSPRATCRS
jgi:hypothetical protein